MGPHNRPPTTPPIQAQAAPPEMAAAPTEMDAPPLYVPPRTNVPPRNVQQPMVGVTDNMHENGGCYSESSSRSDSLHESDERDGSKNF